MKAMRKRREPSARFQPKIEPLMNFCDGSSSNGLALVLSTVQTEDATEIAIDSFCSIDIPVETALRPFDQIPEWRAHASRT
jgi:hypothetical protein